jgi:hypothetical protein
LFLILPEEQKGHPVPTIFLLRLQKQQLALIILGQLLQSLLANVREEHKAELH